uniref:Ig-like domain-containing protein n=1 Tax=Glossina palpalis gambiensis TaxID=67801 RepID=A0A1B0AS09_9MUSC
MWQPKAKPLKDGCGSIPNGSVNLSSLSHRHQQQRKGSTETEINLALFLTHVRLTAIECLMCQDVTLDSLINSSVDARMRDLHQIIQHNQRAGVIVSSGDLAMQGVTRHQAGNYTCTASNVEGDAIIAVDDGDDDYRGAADRRVHGSDSKLNVLVLWMVTGNDDCVDKNALSKMSLFDGANVVVIHITAVVLASAAFIVILVRSIIFIVIVNDVVVVYMA